MKHSAGKRMSDQDRESLRLIYDRNGAISILLIVSNLLDLEYDASSEALSSAIEAVAIERASLG